MLTLFALELPMFFVSTFIIREPFNRWFETIVPLHTNLGLFLRSFQAPLVEEPCKLWLLFLVFRFGKLTPENCIRVGMCIGATFGISEIWGIATTIIRDPSMAEYPFYYFTGFIVERSLVAPIHGVFVVAASRQLPFGAKKAVLGVLMGMGLHYLANFPIILAKMDPLNFGSTVWQYLVSYYVIFYCIAMLLLFIKWATEIRPKPST